MERGDIVEYVEKPGPAYGGGVNGLDGSVGVVVFIREHAAVIHWIVTMADIAHLIKDSSGNAHHSLPYLKVIGHAQT